MLLTEQINCLLAECLPDSLSKPPPSHLTHPSFFYQRLQCPQRHILRQITLSDNLCQLIPYQTVCRSPDAHLAALYSIRRRNPPFWCSDSAPLIQHSQNQLIGRTMLQSLQRLNQTRLETLMV